MKSTILLFHLNLIATCSFGQVWFPNGTNWYYGATEPYSAARKWVGITVDELVPVGGKICKEFKFSGPYHNFKQYAYEDSDVVYWFVQNSSFTILYDFNKKPGESWIYQYDSCIHTIYVDSLGSDSINGKILPSMYVRVDSFLQKHKIIKYIGYLISPFPQLGSYCNPDPILQTDYSSIIDIRCYEDRYIGFHDFKIVPNCHWPNFTGISEPQKNQLNLYPNPVLDELFVQTTIKEPSQFKIYNIRGELVFCGKHNDETIPIKLTHLNKGMYFIEFIGSDNTLILHSKFLKLF